MQASTLSRISTYTVIVRATDQNGAGLRSNNCTVTVTILDLNEPPTLMDTSMSVGRGVDGNTAVGVLIATDTDNTQQREVLRMESHAHRVAAHQVTMSVILCWIHIVVKSRQLVR